jgi:hypothetical protein
MLRAARAALLVVLGGVAPASVARAHPLDPALLQLRETAPGLFDVVWKTSRTASGSLDPELPDRCRSRTSPSARSDDRSVAWRWSVDCGPESLADARFAVHGLDAQNGEALLRLELIDGRQVQAVLRADRPELRVPARTGALDVMTSYGALGVEHILGGFDHLLFVLGLVLLIGGRRAILSTMTAFTAGHSVTLALAALGVVAVPTQPIELLIAVSIVVVALEIVAARTAAGHAETRSLLRRRPWLVAFGFGLLHGFGFAGALAQIGLPQGDIPPALFAFNVGIELGQIAFAAAILLAITVLPRRWHDAGRVAAAYAIGGLAMLWVFERALPMLIGNA